MGIFNGDLNGDYKCVFKWEFKWGFCGIGILNGDFEWGL